MSILTFGTLFRHRGLRSRLRKLGDKPLPPFPTAALPGTPEKVAILEERARRGFALWHPLDAEGAVALPMDCDVA